ncbi:MAG TPA: PilZ domain-containing protein [Polyangiaceae bacterium]|nr:PilZ domain-containing protein [Polyangiaceae bacterium]
MSDPAAPSSATKQRFRAHARRPVRLAAVLAHPERGWQRDVIVFDLGLGGACVEAADVLAVGDKVQVSFVTAERWDPLQVPARVAWRSSQRAGLAF